MNTIQRPAQRQSAITQSILALRALYVLHNLPRGRLSNVEVSITLKMLRGNFQFGYAINSSCRVLRIKPATKRTSSVPNRSRTSDSALDWNECADIDAGQI